MTMLKLHNMAKTLKIKDKQIPQKNILQKVLVDLDKLYNDFDETMMFPIIDIYNLINTYELYDIKSKKYVVCEYFLNFNKSIKNETRVNMFKVLFLDTYGILKQYESIKASHDLEIKRYTELEKEILEKLPEIKPPTIPDSQVIKNDFDGKRIAQDPIHNSHMPLLTPMCPDPYAVYCQKINKAQVLRNDFNKKLIKEDTICKTLPTDIIVNPVTQQKVTTDTSASRIPFIDIRYSNLKQSHDNYNKSIKDDNIIVNPITQQKVVSDASISRNPSIDIRQTHGHNRSIDIRGQTLASEEYVDTELKKLVRSFDSKINDCFDMINAIKQNIEDKDSKIKNAVQECDNLIEKLNI